MPHKNELLHIDLIWCPKRRKAVLVGDVAKDCKVIIEAKCKDKGWTILNLAIEPDHIHLFVRAWPTTAACEIIKECKGITSHHLREKYRDLRKIPSLWTRSYFASTAGNVAAETIAKYIQAQSRI